MFENIVVTDIQTPFSVIGKKGAYSDIKNRSSYGLTFCVSGQIIYSIDGVDHTETPNTAVLLPKGRCYSLQNVKSGEYPLINFQAEGLNCDTVMVIPIGSNGAYLKDIGAMRKYSMLPGGQLKSRSIFYDILYRLEHEQARQDPRIQAALQYIGENLADTGLSNDILARHLGISEVHLRGLFRGALHVSVRQYILELRLRNAMQLLAENRHTVTEVAELCGFSGVYHFCHSFKAKIGCTPTQYRDEHRVTGI